ncbi:MAG: hypothetical protein MJA31_01260 [Clostridia bacterium]|nr:hypothetical protein [Clostridia bacterium]
MKILVCIKQVPDYDTVLSSDWTVDNNTLWIDYANRIANCFDDYALECALRFMGKYNNTGDPCDIHILSIGDSSVDRLLKNYLAYEVSSVTRIAYGHSENNAPYIIAKLISLYIEKTGLPDIIMMGCQSGVYDYGQTPLYTAEILGIRCITHMTSLDFDESDPNRIYIQHNTKGSKEQIQVMQPIVVTVGDIENTALRSCTLKEKLAAKNRKINIVSLDALKYEPFDGYNQKTLREIQNVEQTKRCEMLRVDSTQQAVKIIKDEINAVQGVNTVE